MTNEKLYKAIGEIKDQHILEAKQLKEKRPFIWVKWGVLAACLCLIISINLLFATGNISDGGCGWGDKDTTILDSHREDFSPEIDAAILAQFPNQTEAKKAYRLLENQWFLSNELSDFSQAVSTDTFYFVLGNETGGEIDSCYSVFTVDNNGEIDWDYSAYPSDPTISAGIWGLSYEKIETALADIEYEDYIITFSPRETNIFVWVRCTSGDLFLTYPTRPEFTGLESGGIYTLEELQTKLTEAYTQ